MFNLKNVIAGITLICLFLLSWIIEPANVYTVDVSNAGNQIISGHLKLGSNKSPSGETLDANSLYFLKNGKPWYPVMGEIHFQRYPKEQWEDAILKMKAAGINVIASYIFWIYVEEKQGNFNWTGDNDLQTFVELCKKHNIYFFARVGPWCHGEVRNGGLPDWVIKKGNFRKNNGEYLESVRRFYGELGRQMSGYYFKDGGPIIGAQIENEYRFNNTAGLEHMLTIKKLAIEAGMDVPYYTATGWPGSNQQQDELIPVWGAYPEAPWDKRTTTLPLSENYLFGTLRNDPAIGSDLLGEHQQTEYKGYRYPYATAEMGGGNQITYHRRPIIKADDVTSLAYTKIGSGANLMGYYMFHGGSNKIGRFSTFQESKATKYPNDYPIISYDFLSPIGEYGQLRPSYKGFRMLHTFLNEFGDRLVQTTASFPANSPSSPSDNTTLRMSVRSKDKSGFVFVSNFQRQLEMKDISNVQFNIKLKGAELKFPQSPITIKKNQQAIFPFNMNLDGLNLLYATAQPFCRLAAKEPVFIFLAPEGVLPEFAFMKKDIKKLALFDAKANTKGSRTTIRFNKPGYNCTARITLKNNKVVKLVVLNQSQALNASKVSLFGAQRIVVSDQDVLVKNDKMRLQSNGQEEISFLAYPALKNLNFSQGESKQAARGIFSYHTLKLAGKQVKVDIHEVSDVAWYSNKARQLPEDDRNTSVNTVASPGPQYQTNLKAVPGAKYYELGFPKYALVGLSNLILSINYAGDTGSAYFEGKLIADDFYSGLPFTIGLKKFSEVPGSKILLQIVPLTDERQIYFEAGVREALKGRSVAELKSINVIPQYEVFVSSGSN